MRDPSAWLTQLWQQAIAAVHPDRCLPPWVPTPARGRTVVVGMGKAAGHMARTLETHFEGPVSGLVAVPEGYWPDPLPKHIKIIAGDHPVAGTASLNAGQALLEQVAGLGEQDQVIALISGGGSAAAEALRAGVSLNNLQNLTRQLLRDGVEITEMNRKRGLLSRIKGGGLARAAAPARVITLAISDVPGNHPAVIAGGPTVDLNPKAPGTIGCDFQLIASGADALLAAASWAQTEITNLKVVNLGDQLQGGHRALAAEQAALARRLTTAEQPTLVLSGGELAVKVDHPNPGRGGRNQAFLLELALALDGLPGVWALAADSDGWDGSDPEAGGIIGPQFLDQVRRAGCDPLEAARSFDAYSAFAAADKHLISGATGTNISDIRALLVIPD